MKQKTRRTLIIVLVIVLSLLLGLLTDVVWTLVDKANYPQSYNELVEKYAEVYGVPEYLIYSVIKVESNFRPRAKSDVGAVGLMQMMPKTFNWLTGDEHLGEHLDARKLEEPEVSIRYGTYYLKYLMDKFELLDTALAAYNAGEGNVAAWLENEKYSDGKGALTNIPFSETENYVIKVNNAIDHYKKLYYTDKEN